MIPLEVIKEGILNGDLKRIAEGYQLLTGENLLNREVASSERDNFTQPIKTKNVEQKIRTNEGGKTEVECRREPLSIDKIRLVGNLYTDDHEIPCIEDENDRKVYEETGAIRKQPVGKIAPRNREAIKLVNFECKKCGKTQMAYSNNNPNTFLCTGCERRLVSVSAD